VKQTIRKKQPNSDYNKSKKHCKEKQIKHIFLAKERKRDCMTKKHMLQLSNTVVYFSVFG